MHGTADRGYRPPFTLEETALDETLPFFTVRETLTRNGIPTGPATTRLIPGSTGVTEVVLQLFTGAAAFLHGTVINGGHNWPTPTTGGNPPVATHFDATQAIVEFWRANAGLPVSCEPGRRAASRTTEAGTKVQSATVCSSPNSLSCNVA